MYRTDFWTLGEGEGGMFQENSIETCIVSRGNRSPAQVGCMRQGSGLAHWEDPEESGREGGGRGDRDGEHM